MTDDGLARHLMEAHPDALLVQDRRRRLIAFNRAARTVLGDADAALGEPVACRLVGCVDGDCLHDRAMAEDRALAPVRVELAGGPAEARVYPVHAAAAVTVTAVRLQHAPAREDEAGAPTLRVFVLGPTRVMCDEQLLEGRWLENRPGQLLKFLVTERHRNVFADELLAKLWSPTASPDRRGLRYFIHVLREQLEPHGPWRAPSTFVVATRGGYALNRDHVWVDADAFEQLVGEGLAAVERGDPVATQLLAGGLDLYRGEFLADEPYAEWALAERDRLHTVASDGLRALVELHRGADDTGALIATLGRLAEMEPYDVEIHQDLLSLLMRRGRRSEALRRYERLAQRMSEAFDEPLGFSLAQLT